MTFLYHADRQRGAIWADLFARKAPDIGFSYDRETVAPEEVRFLGIWHPPSDMLTRYENLEVVFSLGAGVDQFEVSAFPDGLPLVRMIEPGIAQGMAEYIALAVMTLHRHFIDYHHVQARETWKIEPFRPSGSVRVGFLGTGVLAQGAFPLLRCAGFPLQAWSRTQKTISGVTCRSGEEGLRTLLAETDILVSLLPLTDETRGILNRGLFECLPRGAAMVNCGRGAQLINDDLLEALASGQLSRAVLDVTDPEPLPSGHPFWTHPKILMTPHTASMTQPDTAVDAVIANIRRHQAGEEMIGLVDRKRR